MEEELDFNNILGTADINNLFLDNEEETPQDEENPIESKETKDTNEAAEVINVDTLFTESPESVGSGEKNIEEREDTTPKGNSSSPNFYSSIAKALKEEGIFPDLDDENLSKIKEPEDFKELIENQIKANFDERQKRIDEALNIGIEPTEIKKYENVIDFLDSLKDEALSAEGDEGEKLRKNLIYQDFINRGYSQERATREVNKSFNSGTDIEDAKEALISNKEYFKEKYNNLIEEAKAESKKEEEDRIKQMNSLRDSILNTEKVFGDLNIDKSTRKRIIDNISKPIYKDEEGRYYTALQKYELEHRNEFIKNIGILFTLTDGFKNVDGLVKNKVKKEVKKGLRELEHTLNNTARTTDGNLRYSSGVSEDIESFIGKGWKLDV